MTRFVSLNSPACTAIWEVSDEEAPLWRYWGPRLPDGTLPQSNLRSVRPEPSFSLAFDQPLSIFPGVGLGWFGQSALLADRSGEDWAQAITSCRVEGEGSEQLIFKMADAVARIDVELVARLDPNTDTLTLSTRLTNRGERPLSVQWLAAGGVPLPCDAQHVRSYGGRHNSEFVPIDDMLSRSLWRRENRRGLTSHDCFPGAIVTCADGTAYGAQFGWSGNHVQQIEWIDDGRWHWQMGEWLAPGEVILAPGDSIATPDMLATCSAEGANGVVWNFHRAIRARMDWPGGAMKPRPVHINTWEGFYFRHDLNQLKALADSAAELGIERYVLDDGWFKGRDDDTSSLGDWTPDPVKYPNGLLPLAEHVTGLGMEFGLWVEPEMVNPDSDMYRAHPDWPLQIDGRPMLTARNQLVLDMTRNDVSDYLFERLSKLLRDLPISYLKWDHNRDLTVAGRTPKFRAQILASYRLFARLRQAFPNVEIEACAGGGGRIDAGIVRYTHRFWISDCNDAVSRVAIQRGFLQFMPPELMGAHVGAATAHSTGRTQSLRFRAGVALSGHMGVELDARRVTGADRDVLKQWIATYKRLRDQLHGSRVWMGEAGDHVVWQAHGDASDLLLLVYRIAPTQQRHQPYVRLDMLDRARDYVIERDGKPPQDASGAWLERVGLPLPAMWGEQALVYQVRARDV